MISDQELDALLRADAAAGPSDADFGQRLLARLPAQRPRQRVRVSRLPRRAAQLAALSTALLAFGLLWPSLLAEAGSGRQALEAGLTGFVLLALIVGWTLPQARLNPWR